MGLRLDTRLSKYLLDHHLVEMGALEDAVQQQVVHGGALDTLLLELGALDEATLTSALTVAWQTEVMAPALLDKPEPKALAKLPSRMALAMAICPVDLRDEILHVAVGAPIDRELLTEVGDLVGLPLKPFVVPEIRLLQALHHAYHAPLEARFQSLLRRIDGTLLPQAASEQEPASEVDAASDLGSEDITPAAAATWGIVEALAHLVAQDSREGIAQVAVSFALRFVPFAAVFGIRNGRAIGWHRAGPCEGAQFGAVEVVIPPDSVVQQVLDSPSPLLGKPPITQGNTTFFGWIGRRRPRTALLIPIVVAQRTVGVLYADGGVRPREIQFLSELVSFGARIGPAFETLLRARHKATAELVEPSVESAASLPENGARKDGTSPFARDYTGPSGLGAPATPKVALTPPPDASSSTSMMPVESAPHAGPDIGFSNAEVTASYSLQVSAENVEKIVKVHRSQDFAATEEVQRDESGAVQIGEQAAVDENVAQDVAAEKAENEEENEGWDDVVLPEAADLGPVERSPSTRIQLPEFSELEQNASQDEKSAEPFASLISEEGHAVVEATDKEAVQKSAAKRASPTKPLHPIVSLSPEQLRDESAEQALDLAASHKNAEVLEEAKVDPATRPPQIAHASAPEEALQVSVEQLPYDERTETNLEINVEQNLTLAGDAVPPVALVSEVKAEQPAEPLREKTPEEWVEELESLNNERVDAAKAALFKMGARALDALARRFPGRLLLDPFGPGKRPTRAKEIGPLLQVVAALGADGLFAAIPHLNSKHASRRFAAVFVFRLLLDERAIDLLPGLLHDKEPRIRVLAAETLTGLMAHPRFEAVLTGVRAMLKSPARDAQLRGVQLLGTFKDVASVPTLISFVEERHADLSLAARAALMEITLQDFGTKTRPWRKWWDRARKVSRIDWLIDGLQHADRDIRKQAITELGALAGNDFGYQVDAMPRERQAAHQAMGNWWTERKRAMGW